MISSSSVVETRNVLHNTASNEWYTPPYIIDSVRLVLGDIDLDPASNDVAQEWIQARQYYTQDTNGYDKEWRGRVFLNPPYGRVGITSSTELWINKFIGEYTARRMSAGIALFNAMTDKRWWHRTIRKFPYFILTTQGLSFIPAHRNTSSKNIYATTIVYLGDGNDDFIQEFSKYGLALYMDNITRGSI